MFVLSINTQKQFSCNIFMRACDLMTVLCTRISTVSAQPERAQILESAFNIILHKIPGICLPCLIQHRASILCTCTILSCVFLRFSTFLSLTCAKMTRFLSEKAIMPTDTNLPDICLFHKSVSVQHYTGLK